MSRLTSILGGCLIAAALLGVAAGPALAGGLIELDFDGVSFPADPLIDNPYWPLAPGTVFTYFAETGDGCEWNIVDITWETKEVAGVQTVVVRDFGFLDETEECSEADYDPAVYDPTDPFNSDNFPPGELEEFTNDWYAQDDDGDENVWYMGEDTWEFSVDPDDCETTIEAHPQLGDGCKDGSFEAGVGDPPAVAGIVMLGDPSKGDFYQQELDEDNAEDWGKVLNFVEIDDVECLKTKEWTPLERGAIEHKYYCPDDGQDLPGLYLIEHVSGGPKVWVELIDIQSYPQPAP